MTLFRYTVGFISQLVRLGEQGVVRARQLFPGSVAIIFFSIRRNEIGAASAATATRLKEAQVKTAQLHQTQVVFGKVAPRLGHVFVIVSWLGRAHVLLMRVSMFSFTLWHSGLPLALLWRIGPGQSEGE